MMLRCVFVAFIIGLTPIAAKAAAKPIQVMAAGASPEGVWSGSFSVEGWQGGLLLELDKASGHWTAAASVQPSGRLATPPVENIQVAGTKLSFELAVENERLRFEGSTTARGLKGTVRMVGKSRPGQWSAVRLSTRLEPGKLPPPTGPFPVGRSHFVWTDEQRHEAASPNAAERRRLSVYVWYPAAHTAKCKAAPYLPDLDAMTPYLPIEVAQAIPNVRIPACSDAPLSSAKTRFPVIIFAGGDEFKALAYSALQMDLASHGYIVAAIDFPYNAPVVVFPDNTRITHVEEDAPLPPAAADSTEDPRQRQLEQAKAEFDYWAHDISFVERQLAALDGLSDSIFYHRIDTLRVGAFGHSRGGLAVFHACQLDTAIHACANLDGRYRERPYPLSSPADAPHQPFLWIRGPVHVFTDDELTQRNVTRQQFQDEQSLRDSIMHATGKGSATLYIDEIGFDHLDFTDFRILETGISAEQRAARERILEMTRRYLLEFFGELRTRPDRDAFPDATLVP
ncbi:MAG TPA: hypothetical protein VGL66_06665 [Caulobacteraceae bacterium]|jgi:predicted dienelactone hydrolase